MQDAAAPAAAPTLTVVVPCLDEVEVLPSLIQQLTEALAPLDLAYEVLVVDDGSTDGTRELLATLADADARVRGLSLARNFGHQAALRAGLDHARGDAVLTMDADLQHPPALIPQMVEAWRDGHRAVLAVRSTSRHAGWLKGLLSRAFYRAFNSISDITLVPGAADFRLLDRSVVQALRRCGDHRPFYRGLVPWAVPDPKRIEFEAPARGAGRAKYTLRKSMLLAADGIFSFSLFPLRLMFLVSAAILAALFVYALWIAWVGLVLQVSVPGWASVIGLLLVFFAYVSIFMAVIGEYVGRIYLQALARPPYLLAGDDPVAETSSPPGDDEPAAA